QLVAESLLDLGDAAEKAFLRHRTGDALIRGERVLPPLRLKIGLGEEPVGRRVIWREPPRFFELAERVVVFALRVVGAAAGDARARGLAAARHCPAACR